MRLYEGCNPHPAATSPPRGPSKEARSPDVLRISSNGSLIPSLILHVPVAFSSPDVFQILGGCCLSPRWGPQGLPPAAVPLLPRDALVSRRPPHIEYGPFTYRCVPHSLMANSLKCHQYSSAVPICPDAPRGPAVAPSSHVQLSSSPRLASSP